MKNITEGHNRMYNVVNELFNIKYFKAMHYKTIRQINSVYV